MFVQVAEWLSPPFEDFFGSTGVIPCAAPGRPPGARPGRGPRQKQRAPSPVAENSRATAPPRKRAKPCALDLPRAKPKRSRSQAQEELPWVERYRPQTQVRAELLQCPCGSDISGTCCASAHSLHHQALTVPCLVKHKVSGPLILCEC